MFASPKGACKGLAKRAMKGKTRTQPAFLDTFVATSNNAQKVLKGGER